MIFQSYTTCNKRIYQEDFYFIKNNLETYNNIDETENFSRLNINVFGIFDGHGGSEIASFLNKELPRYFYIQQIISDNIPKPNNKYSNYILSIFNELTNNLNKTNINSIKQGSTACICSIYKYKNKLYITSSWIGDTRAIACNQYLIAEALTLDHKPNYFLEKIRIESIGGTVTKEKDDVYRINGILSVSRSFGDADQKNYVISIPDIIHRVCDYKFIVMASDGLWDVMSNQDVVDYILTYLLDTPITETTASNSNIAYLLCNKAIELGSSDNITIIICFIEYNKENYIKYVNSFKTY